MCVLPVGGSGEAAGQGCNHVCTQHGACGGRGPRDQQFQISGQYREADNESDERVDDGGGGGGGESDGDGETMIMGDVSECVLCAALRVRFSFVRVVVWQCVVVCMCAHVCLCDGRHACMCACSVCV